MKEGKWTWVNGKFVPSENPQLHVFIQGLQYGYGGFEGIQCYQTEKGPAIFRLQDHIKRLRYTSDVLGLNLAYSDEQIANAIKETIRKNEFTACYIRPYICAAERKIGLIVDGEKTILAISVAAGWTYFGKPVSAKISPYIRPHPKSFPMEAKCSGVYVNSILAKQEAKKHGFDEAILLDHEGYVAEASAANIFVVKNWTIITPETGSILPGITRDTIIKLLRNKASAILPIEEKKIKVADLYNAEEVFVCGTAAEITPVVFIDFSEAKNELCWWDKETAVTVGNGKTGLFTGVLQTAYNGVTRGKLFGYEDWLTYI